jgi:hypothetical protein
VLSCRPQAKIINRAVGEVCKCLRSARVVHMSSRQHNILYLGLDIGPLILHTNSRQGKNVPQILDSNSRQKKISVIESTVTKVRFNDESSMFFALKFG